MMFPILIYMLAAHYLLDYALQGEWMSKAKNPNQNLVGEEIWYHVLFGHALLHATAVQLITGSWILFAVELLAHGATDYAKCQGRFGYNTDQSIHIWCKIAYYSVLLIFGWVP